MIKYRYTNLDPEPPATVTRIATGGWARYGHPSWGDRRLQRGWKKRKR